MKTLIFASACAVIILLAGFSSIASARATESTTASIVQQIRDRMENGWLPGSLTGLIIILYLIFWKIGTTILLNLWYSSRY